jgi:hypothetical protein
MSAVLSISTKDIDLYDHANDVDHNVHDESRALLIDQQSIAQAENQVPQSKATPVPKLQLAMLCLVRYALVFILFYLPLCSHNISSTGS